mmetsp:Transcript_60884/g.166896  ORF Transcript_60884/g.166896 Transcript_60884/m.166896 type:complete len:250 (-) Transcript_60884:45-794(-)
MAFVMMAVWAPTTPLAGSATTAPIVATVARSRPLRRLCPCRPSRPLPAVPKPAVMPRMASATTGVRDPHTRIAPAVPIAPTVATVAAQRHRRRLRHRRPACSQPLGVLTHASIRPGSTGLVMATAVIAPRAVAELTPYTTTAALDLIAPTAVLATRVSTRAAMLAMATAMMAGLVPTPAASWAPTAPTAVIAPLWDKERERRANRSSQLSEAWRRRVGNYHAGAKQQVPTLVRSQQLCSLSHPDLWVCI